MIDSSPPELVVSRWFNTPQPLSLAALKGRVILLHAFQMLCPACVAHGTPQAEHLHRLFADKGLSVLGLHTVFEHHAAMTAVSLQAFIHEYRLTFPIGVDASGTGTPIPITMGRYGMRGTPTTIVIDRGGQRTCRAILMPNETPSEMPMPKSTHRTCLRASVPLKSR